MLKRLEIIPRKGVGESSLNCDSMETDKYGNRKAFCGSGLPKSVFQDYSNVIVVYLSWSSRHYC